MTQVIDMILQRFVEVLTLEMQTNITDLNDLTRAKVVKKGLLQTNKIENTVSIGVTGGDHEDPAYRDAIVSENNLQDIGIDYPAREIGGGQLWWRRGVVAVEIFFPSKNLVEDVAFTTAYEVLGRLMFHCENLNVDNIIDSYDEHAIRMFVYGSTFFQSGGPPTSWIFRGKVLWSCLTERP